MWHVPPLPKLRDRTERHDKIHQTIAESPRWLDSYRLRCLSLHRTTPCSPSRAVRAKACSRPAPVRSPLTVCAAACFAGLGQSPESLSLLVRDAQGQYRPASGEEVLTAARRVLRHRVRRGTNKDTATVVGARSKHVRQLPQQLRRSLTWDRGKEMAEHKNFTIATDVQVYFLRPAQPWQRGSDENTNGLLRQYFPRGTDLSRFSQAYLNRIALRLNQRPRKTLGFETPADRLRAVLH